MFKKKTVAQKEAAQKDRQHITTVGEAVAKLEVIEADFPADILKYTVSENDKITLIMSLITIARKKNDKEVLKKLLIIQILPRNLWEKKEMEYLIKIKNQYSPQTVKEEVEG